MSKIKHGFFNPDGTSLQPVLARTREQKLEHALRAILEMALAANQSPSGRFTKDQTDAIGMWCSQALMVNPADDWLARPPKAPETTADEADPKRLTNDIVRRYRPLMDDEEIRDAVIVKAVTLIALAYGIPPVRGEPFDVDDVIRKLSNAEQVLKGR